MSVIEQALLWSEARLPTWLHWTRLDSTRRNSTQLVSAQLNSSIRLRSVQLNSARLASTQPKSTLFNSIYSILLYSGLSVACKIWPPGIGAAIRQCGERCHGSAGTDDGQWTETPPPLQPAVTAAVSCRRATTSTSVTIIHFPRGYLAGTASKKPAPHSSQQRTSQWGRRRRKQQNTGTTHSGKMAVDQKSTSLTAVRG